MNSHLIDISGNPLNLHISDKFSEIYSKPTAYVQTIINEMNSDKIYQEIFNSLDSDQLRILDIGGNIGLFSFYVYPRCSRILSVEPTPYHVEIFNDIIFKLGYSKIQVLQAAASDLRGTAEFFTNHTNSTMNTMRFVADAGYDQRIFVDTYPITDLINIAGFDEVDFVKLDIEGGEERVVFSEDFAKAANRIHSIYVEVHQGLGINLQNIVNRLKEVGFTNISLTPYQSNQGVYAKK